MNVFIKIPCVKTTKIIPVQEIIRVEASSNYSRIYFSDGRVLVVAKVLQWFEDKLPLDMFTRVHRSHLVNKLFVMQVNKGKSRSLLLINGESIVISRRRRSLMEIGQAGELEIV